MNREIKFRAWDEGNQIMHYDFQWMESGTDGNDWIVFKSDKQRSYNDAIKNPHFQQQLKKMEFTGLKDKNGKEIYEGDVVQCNTKGKIKWPHQGVVEYLGQGEKFYCGYFAINCGKNEDGNYEYTHFWDNENIEIAGNIYETKPEAIEA